MVKIRLRDLGDGWFEWIEFPDDLDVVLSNGKTMRENIKADILANSDKTGHSKNKKILKELGVITDNEHDDWTPTVSP